MKKYSTLLVTFFLLGACTSGPEQSGEKQAPPTQVRVETSMGPFTMLLYNETPKHRDNFLKLVKDRFYDSILFHRVIENFVVQAGDPESKTAEPGQYLGETDLGYTIPAEFDSIAFHKRGAIGAARDNRPDKASSSTQFYIVHGRKINESRLLNDSILLVYEDRINNMLEMNRMMLEAAYKPLFDRLDSMYKVPAHPDSTRALYNRILAIAQERIKGKERYQIPAYRREVYQTLGGVPHLDENYTVFGEIVEGMDVIDQIAIRQTDSLDRPLENVRIIGMELLELSPE